MINYTEKKTEKGSVNPKLLVKNLQLLRKKGRHLVGILRRMVHVVP